LTVICLPACDEVVDNGQSLGRSPILKHPVPAGDHKLTLIRSEPPTTKVVNTTVKSGSSPTVVRQSL
jgi:serine/threonine-protein kinase